MVQYTVDGRLVLHSSKKEREMKLKIDFNMAVDLAPHVHGKHDKDMIVLHETISPDIPGLDDILGVEKYLAGKGYGVHGMDDKEGHIAHALGLGKAIFYHAGGVNERSIGLEQISDIPTRYKTNEQRKEAWKNRDKQLKATAKWIAAVWRAHPHIARTISNGTMPGVTSHWNVSQHYAQSQGHSDCWPVAYGGYYPLDAVVKLANKFYLLGYRF